MYQKSWLYAIWFLRYGVWWMSLLFFILVYFLPFYPPPFPFLYSPKNKISKKWKKRLQISSFYTSVPKMDGRMDGKSDTERWVAHLKIRKDLCRHGLYAFAEFPSWWVSLCYGKFDEKTHAFPMWWSTPQDGNLMEKSTHTVGKVWIPISQVLHIQWVF